MPRRLGPLAAPALLAAGCGPTTEEAAAAVLVALPVALGVGHLFIRLLVWSWRPLLRAPLDARPLLAAVAVAAVGAVAALVAGGDRVLSWVGLALWLFGTSYLTLLLVAWRIWLHLDAASAATWSFFAPLSLSALPAVPLLLGGKGQLAESVIAGWIVVGYGGMVAGPVFLLLLAEVLIRRHRATK